MADVFVFGSNLAGRHGKGAALHAKKYFGAIYGQGVGRQGNSYAIPTKDFHLNPLPLHVIREYVLQFCEYAIWNYWESFHVTAIGTGLAGYSSKEIAPFFLDAPDNVNLPQEFIKELSVN
jgi:hypothetical protein